MAHEITTTDGLVLHKERAWHGMGVLVADAPTPREALVLAGIDWGIEARPLYSRDADGNEVQITEHVGNYRADNGQLLGIVSSRYQAVSNAEVADFCEALQLTDKTVHCETAGTIQGGRRMWMLLKGESFAVANDDEMFPYVLVSNGHDGWTPFRITPTTVRVVCSNTLHAVIPRSDTGELMSSAFVVRHTYHMADRIEEAKKALQNYRVGINNLRNIAEDLASKKMKADELAKFFAECYAAEFGEVPLNPTNKKEENAKARAASAYASFSRRFDDETPIAGASLWCALNAFTGTVQHSLKSRGSDDADRVRSRINSNLFGLSQKRSQTALQIAFARL